MTGVMTYTLQMTKRIPVADIATSKRFCEPTQKDIERMAKSLDTVGQLTAIMVHPVTRNSWRIVAGGTRLRAAFKLGWTHIRADIISGPSTDYKIIELTENLSRRSLTAQQRNDTRAELKRLIAEKLATVAPSKGGRGHKGGVREVARQMGVSKDAAYRAVKLSQNPDPATVSEPKPNGSGGPHVAAAPAAATTKAKPSIALETMKASPISVKVTVAERARIERYNADKMKASISDCTRHLIRKTLDAESY